ncbi:MAG: OmpA family protein [Flavobacteriales bacterium]|nr:OmpA family protein [Flavobacteriales bacterium]
MSTKRFLAFVLFLAITINGIAQSNNTIQKSSYDIKNVNDWCSENYEFKTAEFEEDQPKIEAAEHALIYGKWFSFTSKSSNVLIKLFSDGKKNGGVQFPYIALFDKDLKEIKSVKYLDATDNLSLTHSGLKNDELYYFAIFNHTHHNYVGKFTLCVNSHINYNWKEGAQFLNSTSNYCSSSNVEWSTKGASSTKPGSSCLSGHGNYNRWFKFKAKTEKISIKVSPSGESNFSFPYITLYNSDFKQLSCKKYQKPENTCELNYVSLEKGKDYFFSIDHQNNKEYLGAFKLCLDDGYLNGSYKLIGQMNPSEGNEGAVVHLIDVETQKDIAETASDLQGKFEFKKLPQDLVYAVKIDNEDPGKIDLELFLVDAQNNIVGKGSENDGSGKYEIKNLDGMNGISMFDSPIDNLELDEGKRGVVGKVVKKEDARDGIEGMKISLLSPFHESPMHTYTDKNGDFTFKNIDPSQDYAVEIADHSPGEHYMEMVYVNDDGQVLMTANSDDIDASGKFKFSKLPFIEEKLNLVEFSDDQVIDFTIEKGKTLALNTIYFESNKEIILEESHIILDKLAEQLRKKSDLSVEIVGHTDNTGSAEFNLQLSKKRANTVKDYLIKKGIAASRLKTDGKGESVPVADNTTEKGKKENRRVELKFD